MIEHSNMIIIFLQQARKLSLYHQASFSILHQLFYGTLIFQFIHLASIRDY